MGFMERSDKIIHVEIYLRITRKCAVDFISLCDLVAGLMNYYVWLNLRLPTKNNTEPFFSGHGQFQDMPLPLKVHIAKFGTSKGMTPARA
jgi:hypothetical protein